MAQPDLPQSELMQTYEYNIPVSVNQTLAPIAFISSYVTRARECLRVGHNVCAYV